MKDYNLAENIIPNKKFLELRFCSVLTAVQQSFHRAEVIEEILKIRKQNSCAKIWDSFEIKLADSILNNSELKQHHFLIRSFVNVAGSDIYSLYWKVRDDYEYRLFLNNLVLNSQDGSLNLYKTVLKILDEGNLSNDLKFELACKYFVEERVEKYGKLLPTLIRSSMCCSDPYCVRCIPLKFWQVYLEDSVLDGSLSIGSEKVPSKRFKAAEKHKNNFPFYFKWALYSANDIAVQYLWENLSPTAEDKRKCSFCTLKALLKFGMTNITAYLISKSQDDHVLWEVGNIRDGDEIMGNFIRHCRWHKYIIYIIKTSREKIPISFVPQCTGLISALINANKSQDAHLYRGYLKEFFKIIPTEGTVIELFRERKAHVLFPILKIMDFKTLQILWKIYKETDVLSLLDNDEGLRLYRGKISECSFSEIENFLKKVITSNEVVSKYLSRVVDDCYSDLCEMFILNKNMKGLDLFSNWCEKFLPGLLNNKKVRLSCKSNGNILRQILFSSDNRFEDSYEYSDKVLLWCLGNEEVVEEFKRCVGFRKPILGEEEKAYYGMYFYDDFRKCVERSQYDLLDKFFTWSGCDEETIGRIKSQMSRDNRISKHFCATKNSDRFWRFLRWVNGESEMGSTVKVKCRLYFCN